MAEPADLSQARYVTTGGRNLSLQELLEHWDFHVARLAKDLADDVDDDHAWGAHDFLAAIYARQRLAGGEDAADPSVQAAVAERRAASDALFMALTDPDEDGVVRRFADEDTNSTEWWWSRIPKGGLPRRDLDQWKDGA